MPKGVYALNSNGEITLCTAPLDKRGIGRCNHIDHQKENETLPDFVSRISNLVKVENYDNEGIVDQTENIQNILMNNTLPFNQNPNWEQCILNDIPNYFYIGKDDNFECANIGSIQQNRKINENGDPVIQLIADFEFRGNHYMVDLGEIPEIQNDGTIIMNGSKFRVLPVLSQNKSGVCILSSKENGKIGIFKKENGHISFVINENGTAKIGKRIIDINEIKNYLNGEDNSLNEMERTQIDQLDPIVFERFPDLKNNLNTFLEDNQIDKPSDLSYRKVLTYEDQVKEELQKQFYRMGVTFRHNLAQKKKAEESGDPKLIKKAESLPLFMQNNNTENIRKDLTGRSNVQLADNLNPLSALSQSRKICLVGKGGYNKDKAPEDLRMVNSSYNGLIDTMDISSGGGIGLTINLSNSTLDKRGFIVHSNKPVTPVSDFIPFKYHDDPNRACMAVAHMKQAVPIVGGEDPKLIGDSSDHAWSQIKGSKIGVNLKIAYLPIGGTHEDAVIISESAAKKMVTSINTDYNGKHSRDKIKIGQEVHRGDKINGTTIKYNGFISDIKGADFKVKSTFKMGAGDKLAGRHGNKNTVHQVIPDSEMPKIDDGNGNFVPAEIIMSPASVVGRMNIGQVYETNNGRNFKQTKVRTQQGHIVNATAGTQFIMRLNHIAEKKIQSIANDLDSNRESKGIRLGEMESLIMSSNQDRRDVLNYLRTQESSDTLNKFNSLLNAIGVSVKKYN